MRGTFVLRNGEIVEKGGPLDVQPMLQRSDLPCPMLIGDEMPFCEHVDGKFYTSKSAYRAVTRAHGLTEVGTEKLSHKRPRVPKAVREKAISDAVDKAAARVG